MKKLTKVTRIAFGGLMLVGSFWAQAMTSPTDPASHSYTIFSFPYNTISDADGRTGAPPNGSFADFYDFTIGGNNTVGSNATELVLNLGNTYNIENFAANLWGFDSGSSTWGLVASAVAFQNTVADGIYRIIVEGNATGTGGGLYVLAVTAVPLPPAVILFGAGLIGLAAVARRRNNFNAHESATPV